MAVKIGSLIIRLAVEHGLLTQGLARSEQEVAKTTKAIQRKGREIADFGKNLSLAISVPILGLAAASISAAKESADALGQVNAALTSMGNQAGRTTEQLQALAGSQMKQSLYDDDQILREVTANLLTFGKVSGEQFDRAQQAALDLATRMNGDLKGATIQIGKALNDPVKGLTALGKAGIQFSADQKKMIASMVEAGNVAGAQQMILAELEKQFGGAAQAARDADPGAALTQSFANFQEEIGAKLLPLLPAFTEAITSILDIFGALPAPVQTGVIALGAMAAVMGPIAIGLGAVISAGAGTIALFKEFKLAVDIAGLLKNLVPMILSLGRAMFALVATNPLLAALALSIGAAFLVWKNWDKIEPIVRNLYIGVKTWLQDKMSAVFDWVGKKISQVTGFFFEMYDAVVGNSYVPDMVDGIAAEFSRLQSVMVDPAKKAATSVTEATREMAGDVMGLLDRLFPEFARARKMREDLALLDGAGLNDDLRRRARLRLLGEGQGGATVSAGLLGAGPLVDFGKQLEELQGQLGSAAKQTKTQTVQIAETFRDMADKSIQALDRMANAIKGGGFLDILSSVIGFGLQLGSIGAFGKTIQGNINAPRIPGNANGTAFHPGGLMKVGERGPEILQVPQGGRVIPNHELREAGQSAIRIILDERTDIVEARIGRTVASAAPAIMEGSARVTASRFAQRQSRRIA